MNNVTILLCVVLFQVLVLIGLSLVAIHMANLYVDTPPIDCKVATYTDQYIMLCLGENPFN